MVEKWARAIPLILCCALLFWNLSPQTAKAITSARCFGWCRSLFDNIHTGAGYGEERKPVVTRVALTATALVGTVVAAVVGRALRAHGRIFTIRRSVHSKEATKIHKVSTARSSALLIVVVAALYGTLGPCLRGLYSLEGPPTPPALSLVRQGLTVIVFLPILRMQSTSTTSGMPVKRQRDLWIAGLELAVWNLGSQGLLNAGLALTDATRSSFFTQLSVVITPIVAFAAGQAIPQAIWGVCAIAFIGVIMLGADAAVAGPSLLAALGSGFNAGDLLSLGAAICWSASILRLGIISRRGLPSVPLQAAKTFLLCFLYAGWFLVDWLLVQRCAFKALWPGWASPLAWAVLLFSAIGPGALADVWLQQASERVSAATTNVILSLEPLFAASFAGIFLQERLGTYGYIGAGLIFCAALIAGYLDQDGENGCDNEK